MPIGMFHWSTCTNELKYVSPNIYQVPTATQLEWGSFVPPPPTMLEYLLALPCASLVQSATTALSY